MKRRQSLYLVEWRERGTRKWYIFHSGKNLTKARESMRHGATVSLTHCEFRLTRWVRP